MTEKQKQVLSHGIVALLMAIGLALPMLGVLELMNRALAACAVICAVIALLTLAGCVKKSLQLALYAVLSVGAAAVVLAGVGIGTLAELARAMVLQLSGQSAALPLYARETVLLLSLVLGFSAWGVTSRAVGFYPAMALVLLCALMLWLTSHEALLCALLPAVVSAIALGLFYSHDELPLRRILPVALAIVLLAFFITPPGGVTIAPLKEAADSLRQRIFDLFFFTEQRNVFSLASEGYYPQGNNQLGGTATPTDHPVMVVSTPSRVYLRGAIKNEYTGRTWLNTTGGRRYLWQSARWAEQRQNLFNLALPAQRLSDGSSLLAEQTVHVQLLSDNASNLFVPQRVRTLNPGGDLVPYFNNASEIFATRDLQAGDTYTVTAPLLTAGDAGLGTLIEASSRTQDSAYAGVVQTYTQLPDHLQQMVFDIARQASSGASTPYEKAFAIQNYLCRNFHYTLEVEPQPATLDFVTNFLLNTKEGYCTYFASAMTILCRMVGLPARYVEGYLATPDETGLAYVTGLQAHAWTEVYFQGFGWLTFDATPAQNNQVTPPPSTRQSNNDPEPTPTPESPDTQPDPTPAPDSQQAPDEQEDPTPTPPESDPNVDQDPPPAPNLWWLWLLLAFAVAGSTTARFLLIQPMRLADRAPTEQAKLDVWVQALQDVLHVLHLPRNPSESPAVYARRLDSLHALPVSLAPIGQILSMVYYGKIVPNESELAQTSAAWQKLYHSLSLPQKMQWQLLRFLRMPKKH